MKITATFENREWKQGEIELVCKMKRYWAAQRNRVSRQIERIERGKK